MNPSEIPRAPSGLSQPARRIWKRINQGWILDVGALIVLEQSLRHFDRAEEAKRLVEEQGMMITDDKGRLKENPLVAIERKSRDSMVRCLKYLHLDLEPLGEKKGRK
jgi:P27 family predicted phage terminase small subunit